jgi:hypothetical protein
LLIAGAAGSLLGAELAAKWRNWSHFRAIEAGSDLLPGDLWSVPVPEDLYEHARSDLADLRVVDESGSEVGFVVVVPGREPAAEWRSLEMSDAGFVADQYSQVVADTGGDESIHNAIEVTLAPTDDEIFVWAEVAASDDRKSWRIVRQRAPLFRFEDERLPSRDLSGPVTISYPRTRDRWLRLRLLDGSREIQVGRLRVAERTENDVPRQAVRHGLALRSGTPAGESCWETDGVLPLIPITGVRFETSREELHRPVIVSSSEDGKTWEEVGRGHIYRFASVEGEGHDGSPDEGAAESESLEIELREATAPYWQVTVMDRGDPAIDDLEVRLLRHRRSIVFRSESDGPHRLLYGNHLAEAPEYELVQLTTRDELAAAVELYLAREQSNEAYLSPEPFSERHPVILWMALGLAVVVVGGLALGALR